MKEKSGLMISGVFFNLKHKHGNRYFWCRGYYVDTVEKNKKSIEEYI
ncbi:transposase [Clostridium sporogenes]|nr:transposase [Clostridium sporogenes]